MQPSSISLRTFPRLIWEGLRPHPQVDLHLRTRCEPSIAGVFDLFLVRPGCEVALTTHGVFNVAGIGRDYRSLESAASALIVCGFHLTKIEVRPRIGNGVAIYVTLGEDTVEYSSPVTEHGRPSIDRTDWFINPAAGSVMDMNAIAPCKVGDLPWDTTVTRAAA